MPPPIHQTIQTLPNHPPAIQSGDAETVRKHILADKSLTSQKHPAPFLKFDPDIENDAYKFIGAYLGKVTSLHVAIFLGQDQIAKELIERTLTEDIDIVFGVSFFSLEEINW